MKVQSVNGDTYAFTFEGGTAETIVTNGTDQPGASGTTLSVAIEGPDSWKVVRKQDGHMLLTARWKLSPGGNTLRDDYTEFAPDGQVSLHTDNVYARTADGPGFAGTWESSIALPASLSFKLQIRPYEAGGLSFIHPAQDVTRHVRFDGRDTPMVGHGVTQGATSSGRRLGEHTLEVTDKIDGKISKTDTIELSPDKKTLTRTSHPVGQHGASTYVFQRQADRTTS